MHPREPASLPYTNDETAHTSLCVGRADSQTLQVHADQGDIIVVQINGTKTWTVCAPVDTAGTSPTRRGALLATAEDLRLQSLWDIKVHN